MSPSEPNRKQIWLILWAAFTVAPVLYYVIGALIGGPAPATSQLPLIRLAATLLATVDVVAGGYLMTRAPRARLAQGFGAFFGSTEPARPEAFQLAFVIAASLVEACAVIGFVLLFLGAALAEYLPFGAASLGVMLAVGLPSGMRYWSEVERVRSGEPPTNG